MFCPNCGAQINDGGKFCPACGSALQAASVPNPQPGRAVEPTRVERIRPAHAAPSHAAKQRPAAKPNVSRRVAIAIGCGAVAAVGAGLALSQSGVFGGKDSSNVADPGQTQSSEGYEQASVEWDSAYEDAQSAWDELQAAIASAQSADAEFQGKNVKDANTLTEFETAISDAQAIADGHSSLEKGADEGEMAGGVDELQTLASSYREAVASLTAAQSAVVVFSSGAGSFDYIDWKGYSYHVEYDLNPTFFVDTTEGDPGQVALYADFADCSVTVTNTTSGKKAPGVKLYCEPLYDYDQFADISYNENCLSDLLPQYGPLSSPVVFESNSISYVDEEDFGGATATLLYVNPFGNDDAAKSGLGNVGFPNYIFSQEESFLTACVVKSSYGIKRDSFGDEFEVGESRTFEILVPSYTSAWKRADTTALIGYIGEEYVDRFNDIRGWAIAPIGSVFTAGEIVFVKKAGRSSKYSAGFTYNPVQ